MCGLDVLYNWRNLFQSVSYISQRIIRINNDKFKLFQIHSYDEKFESKFEIKLIRR